MPFQSMDSSVLWLASLPLLLSLLCVDVDGVPFWGMLILDHGLNTERFKTISCFVKAHSKKHKPSWHCWENRQTADQLLCNWNTNIGFLCLVLYIGYFGKAQHHFTLVDALSFLDLFAARALFCMCQHVCHTFCHFYIFFYVLCVICGNVQGTASWLKWCIAICFLKTVCVWKKKSVKFVSCAHLPLLGPSLSPLPPSLPQVPPSPGAWPSSSLHSNFGP